MLVQLQPLYYINSHGLHHILNQNKKVEIKPFCFSKKTDRENYKLKLTIVLSKIRNKKEISTRIILTNARMISINMWRTLGCYQV